LSSGWIAIDDATIEVGLDDAENRGIEERLEAGTQVVQPAEVGNHDSEIFGHSRAVHGRGFGEARERAPIAAQHRRGEQVLDQEAVEHVPGRHLRERDQYARETRYG